MSTLAISITQRTVVGNLRLVFGKLTGGTDYTAAGYAIAATKLGLNSLLYMGVTENAGGFNPYLSLSGNTATLNIFNPTNATVTTGPGTDIGTTDASSAVFNFVAFGV